MTLANNYAPINQSADGITTAFSGSWQMIDPSFSEVFIENTTTGVQMLIAQGVGSNEYQIALSSSGFIVTFNTAPAVGNNIIIQRSTITDQTDPYSTARGFQGGVEEDSFDKLTAIAQENSEIVSRCISVPSGDSTTTLVLPIPTLRAGKALIFDSNGNVIVSSDNYADQLAAVTAQATAAAASAASASSSASTASSAASTATAEAASATTQAGIATTEATSATSSATSAAASAAAAAGVSSGTSTTSNTIGTGSLSFTTQAGRNFSVGQFLVISDSAQPSNYMIGQVTSYNSSTGALVFNSLDAVGSGTYATWNIAVSGPQGPSGGGSTPGGSSGQVQFNNSGALGGIVAVNNAIMVTNGSGVAALSTTIPNGVLATTQTSTDNSTKLATTAFVQSVVPASGVQVVAVQSFTSTGTYTPTTGMIYAIVEMVGAGGGSAGVKTNAPIGGASGGSYLKALLTAAQIGASQAVTIGSGGTAGTTSPTNGGNGGDTSLGTLLSCPGGLGSSAGGRGASSPAAGTVSTGTLMASIAGQAGQSAWNASAGNGAGAGGSSHLGLGGAGSNTDITNPAPAVSGTGYGSGAGGSAANGGSAAGAAGTDGFVIITEFCS